MAQTPNLNLYYSFPGSLPHKSFVRQLSENMSKIDSAYSLISSALSSMASEIADAYDVANGKASEDTFTTTVSTQDWIGSGGASLSAFTVGQTLNAGDKIHFDTAKEDEFEAYLASLDYSQDSNQLLMSNENNNFYIQSTQISQGVYGVMLIDMGGGTQNFSIIYCNSTVQGIVTTPGFQYGNNALDSNGDYTLMWDYTISVINDTTPPTWNGVIIGTGGSATVTAPYTKTVELTGILATDNPVCDIVVSDTYATAEQELIDWSNIYKITTDNGSITLYAKEPPVGAMTIQLKVVR